MWSSAEKESDAPKKRRPLLCACSKQDVVDPNPPPAPAESWLTSPSQPPEAIEDKPARRSSLSDAMAVARENVRMSHAQASKWAGDVSRHTQSFLTAKGWCGSLTVCVGLFAVKIIVSLPVGGNVAIEMHWANLVGSTFDGWGSGDEDAEEKSKVPKALKRLASILVAARKALPTRRIHGATIGVAVDLTCWGVGMEIEADIEVASIDIEEDQVDCFCGK
jgi:hypothetical protein